MRVCGSLLPNVDTICENWLFKYPHEGPGAVTGSLSVEEMRSGSEAGSYLRLIDSFITQLKAQGPSRACNESKEEEEVSVEGAPPSTIGALSNLGEIFYYQKLPPPVAELLTHDPSPLTSNPQTLNLKP